MFKDTVIWNAEEGMKLSVVDVGKAMAKQAAVYDRVGAFMEEYEFLLCPVNQVPPFDVTTPYPTEIDGVEMETYIAWMKSAYYITVTGLPAISVPCGFTPEGLPVRHPDRRPPPRRLRRPPTRQRLRAGNADLEAATTGG